MPNQFAYNCKICTAGPEVVALVEREVALRHSYARISAKTGFSKSTLHRHARRCAVRRAVESRLDGRCPELVDTFIRWANGETAFFPCDHPRRNPNEQTVVEIEVVFEEAKMARQPKQEVIAEKRPEALGDFQVTSPAAQN